MNLLSMKSGRYWRCACWSIFLGMGLVGPVSAQMIKVTLLGTGAPPPVMNRFGMSTLVEAGSSKLLFDVGRGSAQRLLQAKIALKDIDTVFLTHLHSDHVVGLPDLLLTGWSFGQRLRPFRSGARLARGR